MLNISKNSKITFHWKVSPYDYSKDALNSIISKASKKYGISKDKIRVIPDFITIDDKGDEISITKDIVQNIQDPNFQLKLFDDYLKVNNITGYDFDLIKKIDSELNEKIDYQVYDKYRRYFIKWVRWDNFLSYGTDNYFDFTTLDGLVLLTGTDGGKNQCGKTTFGVDLLHFLLFGKTDKADVQSKIFNKHKKDATNVVVEGCLNIDGDDYIIKRTLSRPSLGKRTEKSKVTQKVEYYRIVGSDKEELEEYIDDQQEENSVQTNKVIKEAIGRESDFDLVMSITEANLDALIEKKETERGRLLSRWIGLLPIEEKDVLAREKFNTEIKPYLLSNKYNSETLKQEIIAFETHIKAKETQNNDFVKTNKILDKEISELERTKNVLLSSKEKIDSNVLKLDITTLSATIERQKNEGIKKKMQVEEIDKTLKKIGEIDFSVEEYDRISENISSLKEERAGLLSQHKLISNNIEHLKSSEFCPVCKRKLDNVDNTKQIKEQEKELNKILEKGKVVSAKIAELEQKLLSLKEKRELYNEKNRITMSKSAFEASMANLRSELISNMSLLKEYNKNSEAIDKNNKLDIEVRNNDIKLTEKRKQKEANIREITNNENIIENHKIDINDRKEIIAKISEEETLIKNWKIYLEMVGKNGISKMVFRKTLPIINAKLAHLLSDVCDFDVEVGINIKNDVMFYIIKDGVKSDLSSGSGFEKTAASLALRTVLSELSTVPRNGFVLLDEVTARVSDENLDNIYKLFKKMVNGYEFIFLITHNQMLQNYCNHTVIVEKSDNISKIRLKN